MCGLFGWHFADTATHDQRLAVAEILIAYAQQRGAQSWGAARVGGAWDQRAHVWKGIGPAMPHARKLARVDVLAGHTRYATHGSLTVTNQHPFTVASPAHGSITLAHNGVIYSAAEHGIRHGYTHPVDSYALAVSVARGLPMGELDGYGAAWWTRDDMPGEIRVARLTASGDLAIGMIDGVGAVFASRIEAIHDAAKECGAELTTYRVDVGAEYLIDARGRIYMDPSAPPREISAPAWRGMDPRTSGRHGTISDTWDRWDDDLSSDGWAGYVGEADLDAWAMDPATVASACDALIAEGLTVGSELDPFDAVDLAWHETSWEPDLSD